MVLQASIESVQGIFWSEDRGQGKTVAIHSYWNPRVLNAGQPMRRLSIDGERRSRQYRSPDGVDHPEQLFYSFDYFHHRYESLLDDGELTVKALVQLYIDIAAGDFPYDMLAIDNAVLFQEDIRILLMDSVNGQNNCRVLAKGLRGVWVRNAGFISHRFKTTDNPSIYRLLKDVLAELLRVCQKKNIDVLTATESRNVWFNYGKAGMKILGRTGKLLDPWMQFADFVYEMSRILGDRTQGTAKLVAIPHVKMDTFNPKNSLPGLPPHFELTWDNFWEHALSRKVTTQAELDEVEIKEAEEPQFDPSPEQALAIAKTALLEAAEGTGKYSAEDGTLDRQKVIDRLAEFELTPNDALQKKEQCLIAIAGDTGDLEF